LDRSELKKPENTWMQHGSREGKHTEHLGFLLAEMQHLHRAYPGVDW
jgi:ring-1,2-phenylacetyl-CoA epoxidase subunit PaaC